MAGQCIISMKVVTKIEVEICVCVCVCVCVCGCPQGT